MYRNSKENPTSRQKAKFKLVVALLSNLILICAILDRMIVYCPPGVDPIEEAVRDYNLKRHNNVIPPDIFMGLRFADQDGQSGLAPTAPSDEVCIFNQHK